MVDESCTTRRRRMRVLDTPLSSCHCDSRTVGSDICMRLIATVKTDPLKCRLATTSESTLQRDDDDGAAHKAAAINRVLANEN
jgi:hypothetical protein